ncbi:uroporphyrinogen-III C-methyltransferase [Clostridium sp. YIM B02551]|uniref:uroporphyrinogen-III C-methyltransferase n=1 Tax=Clostridium sp. YIM B02551 TaxID=2910679 RepID=UPI001EEB8F34|nr:uroporphyrinogen-III C-methyltransferase [Clostridium sp. YIM B02551]
MGKVYLIGAGPGDEELITLKGKRKLEECTAVLYDRLVGSNILNFLNKECEVYYCGKEPGCHYKTQDEINNMLVKLAKEGHIVGRIKGGDPYVFGRGGEEALELIKEGIEFQVIPGVTSAISVLGYGGIPITQRGMSQSFHVITGMSANTLKINWSSLAKENGTLVFLMGLENLNNIVHNLVQNGKAVETPTAVIMRGTSSKQKKVVGNLEDIYEKTVEAGLKSPCIIVVGEVVKLNDELNWYEKLPLFGANICVTRSKDQATKIKNQLKDLGAEVTELNSIEFKDMTYNLDEYKNKLNVYDHIVLTSVNAVNYFFDYLRNIEYDIRNIKASFSVLGKATSKALKERGVFPDRIAKEFLSEGLFKVMENDLKPNEKVLIPGSMQAKDYLTKEISKLGLQVDKVAIYETVQGDMKNIKAFEEVDIVLFTSPTTVNNLINMIDINEIREKICIAIGPVTYEALKEKEIDALVCEEHSQDGLINKITEVWRKMK